MGIEDDLRQKKYEGKVNLGRGKRDKRHKRGGLRQKIGNIVCLGRIIREHNQRCTSTIHVMRQTILEQHASTLLYLSARLYLQWSNHSDLAYRVQEINRNQ